MGEESAEPQWSERAPHPLKELTDHHQTNQTEDVENIENNMAVAMMRKENESTVNMLNLQDNGEDGKTKSTRR